MTLYATEARNKEAVHLKFRDVDSKRMVIHIKGGKGRKDRLCAMAHDGFVLVPIKLKYELVARATPCSHSVDLVGKRVSGSPVVFKQ